MAVIIPAVITAALTAGGFYFGYNWYAAKKVTSEFERQLYKSVDDKICRANKVFADIKDIKYMRKYTSYLDSCFNIDRVQIIKNKLLLIKNKFNDIDENEKYQIILDFREILVSTYIDVVNAHNTLIEYQKNIILMIDNLTLDNINHGYLYSADSAATSADDMIANEFVVLLNAKNTKSISTKNNLLVEFKYDILVDIKFINNYIMSKNFIIIATYLYAVNQKYIDRVNNDDQIKFAFANFDQYIDKFISDLEKINLDNNFNAVVSDMIAKICELHNKIAKMNINNFEKNTIHNDHFEDTAIKFNKTSADMIEYFTREYFKYNDYWVYDQSAYAESNSEDNPTNDSADISQVDIPEDNILSENSADIPAEMSLDISNEIFPPHNTPNNGNTPNNCNTPDG